MKCPICGKSMSLIYVSEDGKAKFYQCKMKHAGHTRVYMVK